MCGGPDIPAPDPQVGEAAKEQIQFARDVYNDYKAPGGDRDFYRGVTDRTMAQLEQAGLRSNQLQTAQLRGMDLANEQQRYELDLARRNDDRYFNVAVPFEDRLLQQVNDYDTDAFREAQVGRALADTQMQFDSSRQQGIRSMTRRGSSPESGAYAAMMNDGGRAQALAMATAANKTRLAAQQIGLSNKMQMYGGMKGLAGLGATSAQLAIGAGGLGVNAGQAASGANMASMAAASGVQGAAGSYLGANSSAAGMRGAGVAAGINSYNGYYGNQVNAANVAAQNDPFSTILGTVVGVGSRFALGKMF